MISYHRINYLLHYLFCEPLRLNSFGFRPSFSTDAKNFQIQFEFIDYFCGSCVWWHEEPLNSTDLENMKWRIIKPESTILSNQFCHDQRLPPDVLGCTSSMFDINFALFVNSEKSDFKKNWLKQQGYYDWYFFFHGFASLDWFRDYKYLVESNTSISKLFISLNHLIYKKRSYRLTWLSHLTAADLLSHGFVSAPLACKQDIKDELLDPNSLLSSKSKIHIFKNLLPNIQPLMLDNVSSYENASADIIDFKYAHGALWHIVSETVFYDDKLHLTEKIFKPIVTKRPFMLIGARKNLEYLKSYGFRTFDRWIDESYDDESDPDIRIKKIVAELEKLKGKDLIKMHQEMKEILEYNHQHFFGKFKELIIDEMIDNFKKCVFLHNRYLTGRFRLPEHTLDFVKIKNILMQN